MLDIASEQGGSIDDAGGSDEEIFQFQMMALDRPAVIPRQGRNFSVHINHRQAVQQF